MLLDFEYRKKKLIISYIKNGNIKLKYYDWPNPTKFVVCDYNDTHRDGKFVTWDGKSVKKIYTTRPDRTSIYYFLDSLPEDEREEIFKYDEPNIFFVDIENEITVTKPEPHKAETEIQTISIVHKNKAVVLGSKDLSIEEMESINRDINLYIGDNYKFSYIKHKNEYDLLYSFFNRYVPKMCVITGWNFKEYDWVFLVNRARNIGIDPSVSSFTKKLYPPNKLEFDKYGNETHFEMPAHRLIVDYMELYKKWDTSIRVKESDGLDFTSENLVGLKKVNYEGNLKILYETDYKKFVYYNVIDSILVQKIHEKMRYIDILYGISTLSRIKIYDGFKTIPVTEGVLRRKLLEEKNIVLCKDPNKIESEKVKGGWVKVPTKGMSMWTCCYDYASLYPTSMRQFNISPDSYRGIIQKDNTIKFNKNKSTLEKDDIVTVNGAVYCREEGVVTKMLTEIYSDRKRYKKLMIEKETEREELKRKQHIIEEELL